jgi:hypothetical protein
MKGEKNNANKKHTNKLLFFSGLLRSQHAHCEHRDDIDPRYHHKEQEEQFDYIRE